MMDDLISRQQAIDAVNKYKIEHGFDYYDCACEIERDISDLSSVQPEQCWIPCSERLPEDVQIGEEYPSVIFCTKDATYTGFYEYYLGGRWWTSDGDYVVDGVIAWMPLPEPYREEGEQP